MASPFQPLWSVWHQGIRFSRWEEKHVFQVLNKQRLLKYWAVKDGWEALGTSVGAQPIYRRLWAFKWATNTFSHAGNMKKWKFSASDSCPGCGQPEQRFHILGCPHLDAPKIWDRFLTSIDSFHASFQTLPILATVISTLLNTWLDQVTKSIRPVQRHHSTIKDRSWPDVQWAMVIHLDRMTRRSIESRRSGQRWLNAILKNFFGRYRGTCGYTAVKSTTNPTPS